MRVQETESRRADGGGGRSWMEREAGGRPWGAVRNLQDAPPAVFISLLVSVPHPHHEGLCNHKSEAVIVY